MIDAMAIRRRLADPAELCRRLNIEVSRTKRQHRGVYARCVAHADETPSMSVRVARDGTVAACCMSCGWTGDAIGLVAAVHGLDAHRDGREVMRIAAELAGMTDDAPTRREPRPRPESRPPDPPSYPPADEVAAVWASARFVCDDAEAAAYLAGRGLKPDAIPFRYLARVLPIATELPRWASLRGRPWTVTGHRIIVPVYDCAGTMRAVRGWSWIEAGKPKRLAAAGYTVRGLVLANPMAREILMSGSAPALCSTGGPLVVVITEGEPDYLAWATRAPESCGTKFAVLGIAGAGAWTQEIATRIPSGARVIIRTDHDLAGEKYAAEVDRTIGPRCTILRSKGDA